MPDSESKFVQIYSNLPLKTREEIIVVVENKPISWNVAYQEIAHKTKKGEEILEKLKKMKIID